MTKEVDLFSCISNQSKLTWYLDHIVMTLLKFMDLNIYTLTITTSEKYNNCVCYNRRWCSIFRDHISFAFSFSSFKLFFTDRRNLMPLCKNKDCIIKHADKNLAETLSIFLWEYVNILIVLMKTNSYLNLVFVCGKRLF